MLFGVISGFNAPIQGDASSLLKSFRSGELMAEKAYIDSIIGEFYLPIARFPT